MTSALVTIAALQIGAALAATLDGARPRELRADQWTTVAHVYYRAKPSTPAPLWLDGDRLAPRAGEMRDVLAVVDTLGLRSRDYPLGALSDAFRAVATHSDGPARTAALARADVLLSASFVSLVDDLLAGRVDPREVEPTWRIGSRTFDISTRVEAALDEVVGGRAIGDVLAGLRPDYDVYFPLLRGLARYRTLERAGGWPSLSQGPTMRPGDVGPRVGVLRSRLAAEGYHSGNGGDTLDAALAGAIAAFQLRHGLNGDSLVGSGTRAALNVPASRRVSQIEANLERLRWLPIDPGGFRGCQRSSIQLVRV